MEMIGEMARAACEVAYWSAVYQFVKKALIAIERGVSQLFSLVVHEFLAMTIRSDTAF